MGAKKTSQKNLFIRYSSLLICCFLILATLMLYCQVCGFDFINFDDQDYVTENALVTAGLTTDGFLWAFTATHASNWHPLTWLSHMLDCQLFGLDAGRHHLTSVLLHILNAVLLYFVLKGITRVVWQSGLVAVLFALHPLHVESVAWVAERKDVLSTLFFMLTLWCYYRYVKQPGAARYVMTLLSFVLGLMSKPMLVTLPFVLLLFDYWPLERLRIVEKRKSGGAEKVSSVVQRLIVEKVPFFALAIASCVVTFAVQQAGGAVRSLKLYPFGLRAANALVSYVVYIIKSIFPHNLAIMYPHLNTIPWWKTAGALVGLLAVSVMIIRNARQRPYLAVGWLWYLGTLVPVIGLVQVGEQAMADRYTYISIIGLFIMVAWGAPELLKKWRLQGKGIAIATAVVIAALMGAGYQQVGYWRNSITLFEHTIAVTHDNSLAHINLGAALNMSGRADEAIKHFTEALRITPGSAKAHYNFGLTLYRKDRLSEAIKHYKKAIHLHPDYMKAHYNLGLALNREGRTDEAVEHYRETIRINPGFSDAYNNLGNIMLRRMKLDEAIANYRKALQIQPNNPLAHNNLGIALMNKGNLDEAILHYKEALRIKPNYTNAKNNLSKAMDSQKRNLTEDPK